MVLPGRKTRAMTNALSKTCMPRTAVLDGTADFVVNLADLAALSEDEACEFLDSNVLTSGMEMLLSQAFARMAGTGSSSGIYKLSESMGGGKTQSMIVAGILARFPHLAKGVEFREPLANAKPDVVASFTGRSTDKKVWVAIGEALGVTFAPDRAPSEAEWRDVLKDRSALNLAQPMPDDGMQVLMFTHKSTDVWEDLALIMWAAGLQVKQVWSIATKTPGAGIRTGNYVQATYNMVLRKRTGNKQGFVDFITPAVNKRVKEVITRMRESQIEAGLARCGYTDTDYLLAAQAAAAEVVTGYASIDGVDLEAELTTPNAQRGRSALRTLMENAKRTATDFLLPPAMDRAIRRVGGGDAYQFWRQFSPEEKFLLKGLEGEAQGVCKLGAFQDLGRAYGLVDYESLLGPTRANDTRTALPEELPRPDALRFDEVPASERGLWRYSPTRHIYHALKLLADGAEVERAVKHLVDSTDLWNLRTTRLAVILAYLQEMTTYLPHWAAYQGALEQLAIGVEHHRD